MKRLKNDRKGQFVIIAVLMIAVMIISIGALMHRAVTYYKHEPWEEYLTVIGNIELNSRRLVELSLSNYTQSFDQAVLKSSLEKWQNDLIHIYLGRGVQMSQTVSQGLYNVYGASTNYTQGLNCTWMQKSAYSTANASFSVNMTSIGLTGYRFISSAFLNLTTINVTTNTITVFVAAEDNQPVTGLSISNFQVEGYSITDVKKSQDQTYRVVYEIKCGSTISGPVNVTVWDARGIKVTSRYA